jgi:hypothetical protein
LVAASIFNLDGERWRMGEDEHDGVGARTG